MLFLVFGEILSKEVMSCVGVCAPKIEEDGLCGVGGRTEISIG